MSEPLEIVDDVAVPAVRLDMRVMADPKWDYARSLIARGRQVATELATEIARLREFYVGQGIAARSAQLRQGAAPKITNVIYGNEEAAKGFQARLREQLGLHPEQARRILQEAEYQERIALIALMEVPGEVILVPGKGRNAAPVPVEVTPRMIELAREAREVWGMPAAPKASRQWAGIAGESQRVDVRQEGSVDRAAPDNYRLLSDACLTVRRCARNWDRYFDAEQKAVAIEGLGLCLADLPEHVLEAVVSVARGGRR